MGSAVIILGYSVQPYYKSLRAQCPSESNILLTIFKKKYKWYLDKKIWKPRQVNQGFGSGSALIWAAGSGSGSGSRRAKMTPKNRKKDRIFIFWSAGCSLLRAESFSCSLGVLYGGLGISKLQILIKKIKIKFLVVNFFQFWIIRLWIRIRDPDPGSRSGIRIRNPDPQLEKMLDPDQGWKKPGFF